MMGDIPPAGMLLGFLLVPFSNFFHTQAKLYTKIFFSQQLGNSVRLICGINWLIINPPMTLIPLLFFQLFQIADSCHDVTAIASVYLTLWCWLIQRSGPIRMENQIHKLKEMAATDKEETSKSSKRWLKDKRGQEERASF